MGRGSLLPVSVVAASTGVGVTELLDLLACFGPRNAVPDEDGAARSGWGLSEPFHPVALPGNEGDSSALASVLASDPSLRLERRSGQTLLWSLGPEHARISLTAAGLLPAEVTLAGGEFLYAIDVLVTDVLARPTAAALGRLGATTGVLRPADEPGLTVVPVELGLTLLPRLADVLSTTAFGTAQVRWHERA